MDKNDDGLLDRHYGYPSYIGSGAWETNSGEGYFCKIVAVPTEAALDGGMWYLGTETNGPEIWEEFAIIQECISGEGATIFTDLTSGFGFWN